MATTLEVELGTQRLRPKSFRNRFRLERVHEPENFGRRSIDTFDTPFFRVFATVIFLGTIRVLLPVCVDSFLVSFRTFASSFF